MAFRYFIGFLLSSILVACAQVGQITGGEKDTVAPQLVDSKTTPPNNSIYFSGNSFSLTFDEFIQVNNPQQTLVMVPKHARPTVSITKKTATVEWKEKLEANTTYVVYLNGTIEDVAEGNDSLMAYAFSTGSFVDSLRYSVKVEDAFTNAPLQDITVGLFNEKDSTKPYYFAKSASNGVAVFNFLKQGNYFVKAFKDENKDLELQENELVGFKTNSLQLSQSIVDSIPIRLFKERGKEQLKSLRFLPPNSFVLSSNYALEQATIRVNNEVLQAQQIRPITSDSIQFFKAVKPINELEVIVDRATKNSDTITLRLTQKEKTEKYALLPTFKDQKVRPNESISFRLNDLIETVTSEKIRLVNKEDSTEINHKVLFSSNELSIEFERSNLQNIQFIAQKGALKSKNGLLSDSINLSISVRQEKEFGIINMDLSAFKSPLVLEILQANKTIKSYSFMPSKKCVIPYLEAGEYQFRVILDENKNGIWDTGNVKEWQQPEKCLLFTNPIKVRSNWEIDAELIPN